MAIGNHGRAFIVADLFGNSRQSPARVRGRQRRAWGGAERNPRREGRFISPTRERGRQPLAPIANGKANYDGLPPALRARGFFSRAIPGVPRVALHPRLDAVARVRGLGTGVSICRRRIGGARWLLG